jgi:hypothetical protein
MHIYRASSGVSPQDIGLGQPSHRAFTGGNHSKKKNNNNNIQKKGHKAIDHLSICGREELGFFVFGQFHCLSSWRTCSCFSLNNIERVLTQTVMESSQTKVQIKPQPNFTNPAI